MRDIQNATNGLEPELDKFEYGGISGYSGESEFKNPFDEAQEMELAADLLEVADEAELDQFLANLIRRASQSAGLLLPRSTGRSLVEALKGAVKKASPHLGRAIGTHLNWGRGGDTGANLASQAARAFGLELEGLSPEDQEFELARSYVRFAGDAVKRAMTMRTASPQGAARSAIVAAAQQHAPGLINTTPDRVHRFDRHNNGRWLRCGRTIVIVNA